jgi:hypothetical protein
VARQAGVDLQAHARAAGALPQLDDAPARPEVGHPDQTPAFAKNEARAIKPRSP